MRDLTRRKKPCRAVLYSCSGRAGLALRCNAAASRRCLVWVNGTGASCLRSRPPGGVIPPIRRLQRQRFSEGTQNSWFRRGIFY